MNLIKCPACGEIIDNNAIKRGPKHRNPFKRRVIQCDKCKVALKASRFAFLLVWLLLVSGPFAVVRLDSYAIALTIGGALILILLMTEGYAFNLLDD
ncbi:hypothetical protein ACU6U9_15420 [Pseudomonas sp. HK3]|jgi:hypothetical protein